MQQVGKVSQAASIWQERVEHRRHRVGRRAGHHSNLQRTPSIHGHGLLPSWRTSLRSLGSGHPIAVDDEVVPFDVVSLCVVGPVSVKGWRVLVRVQGEAQIGIKE